MSKENLDIVWRDPSFFLAFGFGSGLLSIAPGTWGTLAAVGLYFLVCDLSWPFYFLFVLLLTIFGVWLCERVSNHLGVHDHSGIVIDEIAGYLITMCFAPYKLTWLILGFFLFRLFDIWKPGIIGLVDKRVHGGLGIMLDDVLAGIAAMLVLQSIIWLAS